MSNRKSSLRFVSTVIAIIAISVVTYASPWTQALSYLGISMGGSAEITSSVTANAVMTAGTCDTAGPIEVEGSILGTTPTAYSTLGAAFSAINGGTHTGAITIDVCGNTDETTVSAVLNASGSGAASYTSIAMSPAGGASRTITGAPAGGTPMIDLNGVDNLTIDGLNTGGNSLTIANTTVSATSATSTIRFIGGATNNTITNSNIQGSGTMSVATNGAVIFFSTDAVTANGNDNNTISNNNIGPAGANLPTKGILCNGSATTTAIGNSGNIVNNNNIFDYFGATVTSAGVASNGGCNAWSITNNRFYQTGTRTWTTGALHNAINIGNSTATSGAQGFTITGNIVGYASNTQTGTYTLTGSTGTFRGIVFNGITGGTVSNINNNTVAAVSLTGVTSSGTSSSAPFMGIYVTNGVAITNNNTIGSQSATDSLTYATNSASAADVMGMFNFSLDGWTANNNNIGGITSANGGAGAANAYGIRLNTSSSVTTTLTGNNVGGTVANSIQSTSTAAGTQVAGIFVSTSIATATSNTVRNLSAAGGTGTTTAASVVGIDFISSTPVNTASQNTIFNLSNSNTSAATVVTGIQFTGGTGNIVERNSIHSLTSATNSTTAEINGIRVAGGTTTYRNNMIALGANQAIAIGSAATNSGTSGINGFNGFLGTDTFVHNSVYIGGTAASGSGASYALNGTQTVNTRSFRDNIFFNARTNSGATGSNYAVKINGTAANPSGLTINNNLYFVNGTGGVFGYFNGTDVANLSAWKTAVGQDSGSFESNPQFNDPTNATPDLHLHPTLATVAEGNGVDVGVTNDFDGQTRASLTPVDIGADAGNFSGVDLSPPSISYTGLGNTSLTTNRPLNVVITDVTGTATGGNAPRVYFNKNAGSYFSTACSLSSGTVQSGQWLCTIDNSLLGGVVATDVVRYFVVAQDTLGNLGATPSGGFTGTDVNTVITPPTTPNQYTIVTAFTGSFNIGTGETYTSLTNTGGIFEAINAGALTGNVILNITTDLLTETGTVALNQWAEDGVGGYTLTIKPSGAPRQIVGTNTGALVRFSGTDRVTIDGSTTGGTATGVGGNAALRELTIQNTNTGTAAAVIAFASGTNGAQNNTVRNTNILGQDPTTTLIAIAFGGNTTGTVGTDNDGNRVENCSVKRAIYGIYSAGLSAANQNTGTVITRNDLSSTTTDRVRRVGIVVFNDDGAQITENSIATETNESADAIGIGAGIQGIDTTTVVSGAVTNALVARNKINGIASLSTTGFSASGIAVAGGTTGPNTIVNNMITGVTAPSTSPDIPAGIFVAGVAGSSTKVYNNSVSMTGDRGSVATQTPGFGIAITGTDPTVELKNNIFYTTQIASGGGVNAKSYAIGMVTTTFANLDSNYNDFWSTGANDGGFRSGSLTTASGLDYADITAWRTAISDDLNSLESDPTYVDPLNNLHLIAASPMTDVGTTIASVTNDFDGDLRFAPYEIGADEFPDVTNPDTQILTTPSDPSNSADATFTFTGTDALVGGNVIASYECQIDGGGFSACTSPKTYTGLSQGSHTFQVRAKDGAGNVDPTPASFTWTIDAIAPDTTILTNPTNPSNSSSATFTFSGTDSAIAAIASFECKIDGGSFATCTSPQSYTGLADGSHTFQVRAKDTVGNVDPTPASYTWAVDTVAPTASLDTLPPNPSNSSSATFAFSAIDPAPASGVAGFECQLDAGGFAACTSPVNLTGLSQGSHTFTVKATDAAGNTSVPTFFTWSVDAVAPDTQILTNPPDPSASSSATFTFTGTDSAMAAVASFECKLDGGSFAACTSPKNYAGLSNGSHTFEVRAVDGVGNVDPSPASYTWTVNVGPTPTPTPQTTVFQNEIEPNGTAATATVVTTPARIKGYVYQNGDIDYYAFPATAGDKVYSAVMTSASANASTDSQLRLYASDGTTEIEFDEDDGSFGTLSSTIAGATIPSTGTYYLRVNHFSATNQLRPYELYIRLQSGGPTPETESNDTPASANTLPSGGWVSGVRSPAAATEQDWYAMTLNAGDTVYLGLDLDPERDNVQWNGRLGLALFGDAGNQILVVDDGSTGSVANPLSEAFFFTVKTSGTYYAFVDSASAATGGPTATYNLSVTVFPKIEEGVNCTTYTSTNVPQTIGPGTGLVSSTITIPGSPRIADLDVSLNLTHALMADVDAHLRSPAGNDIGLFTDIGAAATGGQTQMDLTLDDEAGITPAFTVLKGIQIKPELAYSLSWFDGENAGGTWTLDLRDDGANASGGTLNGWSIKVCEQPAAVSETVVFGTDFESGAAGFTSSGTANEWEIGLPATVATTTANPIAAFNSCNSGVSCWKTDLDNTYDVSSSQDLLSPNINLTGVSAPISLKWAQQFQMENATFDHARVVVQQVGNPASAKTVWEWTGPTMVDSVGNPTVNIGTTAGWGNYRADISSFAGQNIEVIFHVDSDTSVNMGGLAIDDVAVVATDTTAPDTQILTNPTNPSNSADATFTFTGTDSAVAVVVSYECQIDGGGFSTCTSPQSYMGLSQGSHTFQVRAKDGAGNVDPTPASYTWTIDAIAPDTQLLSTPTDPSNSSNATFTFTGTDSLLGSPLTFECQIDGGGFSACTSPKNYTGLADGSHTFQVRAIDGVGNIDPTPASYTWTINTVPASPVTVTATAGTPGPTGYNTVKEAFDAINAGTHQGAVTVSVNANTTETASAVLNASGGTSAYTSVLVRPTAVVSVSGSIVGAVIKLNGADNVTIDGRIGGTGSSRDLTVANNSNTTATAAIWLSSLGAGAGASGNTIRNVEIAGGAPQNTGTLSTYGIIMSGTAISTTSNGDDNDNNSFIANRIIRVRYGILTRGVTTNLNANPVVTDNIIGPAAFGTDAIGKVGIFMQADAGATVSRNTVQFVGGDFANTSGGADRVGIAIGSDAWGSTPSTLLGTGYTVSRNVIHDVIEERTFSSVGIYLGAVNGTSPTNNVVANNFVYNVKANGTLGDTGVGIGIAGGNGDSVVFNSVRMEGDMDPNAGATAPTQTSVNMRIANTPSNLTVKNNSLYNDVFSSSTPALNTVNIQVQTATFAFGTGGLNNNNYYYPVTNTVARTGAIGTTSLATTFFATLANWQAAITPAQDAASIQADPQYVSASDLHIALASPNVNTGAAGTGVVNDIDGQLRDATPDIGADEPNGVTPPANDIAAVSIISPVTGSNLPNGSTVTPQAKFANVGSATQTGVNVQFTITGPGGYSYTGNQTIASIDPDASAIVTFSAAPAFTTAGGYTTTATVTTSDTNPGNNSTGGSFNVLDPLNGPYTVGTSGAFTSLTNPGGLFDTLNTIGATGNVTANITTDLTTETGAIQLNQLPGGFGLTIKPSGAPRTISGNGAALGLIRLFGADNVTIDGSLSGGTDRSLTITYGNTGGAVIWIGAASAANGALGTTIKNTNLSGNPATTIIAGIIAGSGTTLGGAAESPNSNTTIQNNWIYRVQNSIYNQGAVAFDQNWNVTGNTFGSTVTADKNSFRGMLIGNVQNFVVNGNTIAGISSTPTTTAAMSGIQLAFAINGGSIVNNVIRDIRNNSASGTGAYGINVTSTSAAANVTIANNSVSDVAALGSATVTSNGLGINFNATGAAGYKLYHNSVNMNANQGSGTTAALNVAAGVTAAGALDVQNNIFANTQTSGATRYAVYSAAPASVFTPINYNDYFAANVGFIGGSARVTLGDWQTATTQDANSLAVDPLFVGPTNLHISAGSPMIDAAVTIPAVNSDFDGQTRPIGAANDIGADEWVATITISGRVLTSDGQGIKNVLVSLTDSGAGPKRSTLTGPFGYYSFTGQPSNLLYTVSVGSKRFTFTPNFRDVGGYADITDFDFIADPLP